MRRGPERYQYRVKLERRGPAVNHRRVFLCLRHSLRSATAGSTDEARLAGSHAANQANNSTNAAAVAMEIGAMGDNLVHAPRGESMGLARGICHLLPPC